MFFFNKTNICCNNVKDSKYFNASHIRIENHCRQGCSVLLSHINTQHPLLCVQKLWLGPDGRDAGLDQLQSHFCSLGSFALKSNLESARNPHKPKKKVAAGFVVFFQDQILSSENHSPSVISLNPCHQLSTGLLDQTGVQSVHFSPSTKCRAH